MLAELPSKAPWLQLAVSLARNLSKVEDEDLSEAVIRAWTTFSYHLNHLVSLSAMLDRVRACDVGGVTFISHVHEGIRMLDEQPNSTGIEQSLHVLYSLVRGMEILSDAEGHHAGDDWRVNSGYALILRRTGEAPGWMAPYRFLAERHRHRGERDEAEQALRKAIETASELWSPWDPVVFGYVSVLRIWLVEWYGEGSVKVAEVTRWQDELRGRVGASAQRQ
ncbi:hypothetical protein M406DRAFT_357556 [Cryphonectria parasitica EP155]|uniref:Uncharacterized protein n=1 Tax=Cryphonectria parasitica (strain ATCC 38755 / EP155) TaxID=660469 RepID=A0A9P4XWN8_CRYP1|nr:uncharacterized protein M406DRAFT_357556 [Cryphonectria parasitica EP155]KAF3762697.1 hypothetical protein M406DRAFT_357556 [Cryphonectria parasitica EP155]